MQANVNISGFSFAKKESHANRVVLVTESGIGSGRT
jgi:hypothetical protein